MGLKTYTRDEAIGLLRLRLPKDGYCVNERYIDLIIDEGHITSGSKIPEKDIDSLIEKVNGSIVASKVKGGYEKPGRVESIMRSEAIQKFYLIVAGVRRVLNRDVPEFEESVRAAYMENEARQQKKLDEKVEAVIKERDELLEILGESHRLLVEDLMSLPPSDGFEAARKYRSMIIKALSGIKKRRLYDTAVENIRNGKERE